jgi:hypothetical protein
VKIPFKIQPDNYGDHIYTVLVNTQLSLQAPNSPRTKRFEAVVDSGASRCMFHADIGRRLGLDIKAGDHELTQGIGGPEDAWIHPVKLFVFGAPIDIYAAFKEGLPCAGLLGMNGFFDHFLVSFIQPALTCEVERIVSA